MSTGNEQQVKELQATIGKDAPVKCTCPHSASTSTITTEGGDEPVGKTPEDPVDDYYNRYTANQATVRSHQKSQQSTQKHPRKRMMSERSRRSSHRCEEPVPPKFLRSAPLASALRPLRHILHVVILIFGWMLGTCIFYAIEVPAEHQAVADTYVQLNDAFKIIADDLVIRAKSENETEITEHVKKAYIKLLEIEGKWRWSAIQKTEGPEAHYMWTFGSSFFFTFTLFTTVGYGSIFPGTDLGRLAVILYSCIFYPFSLVVIRDLGQLTLIGMTRIYGKVLIKIREARGYLTTEWETITLPWWITAIVSFAFIALCGVFFKYYDEFTGPQEGLSYFIAFYFSFLSFTAIGLGDIMPNNVPWAPIVAIIIMAGLPLMRVITKMTYARMENAYFGIIIFIESRLGSKEEEEMVTHQKGQDVEEKENEDDDDEDENEKRIREELMRNFTIRSLATYISSGKDVYGGEFARVNLRKSEL
ncbi:hypothetical protein PRIPAC_78937 [Pristionchus pacificus]|uniref:Ion channel n=1 Tax=Pristionchus pacificus TaxID=54126 RepID=A0A2A6C420_PRIPA|nr:hypothetical protein PRIPAC_78937 [Pristionchus pacificus]|eukprot:PDM72848.1 ion channel [Pristionchus pacificus]